MRRATRPASVGFVCSGNICRSPMAEALARRHFSQRGLVVGVSSRGTLGIEDHPAAAYAIHALADVGIDLSSHRSAGVTHAWIDATDWIVVMAEEHAQAVELARPAASARIVRLWEFAADGRLGEIEDPVGRGLQEFVRCRRDLEECLTRWIERSGL